MATSPTESVLIRAAAATDSESLAQIYNHYINNTVVTFEELPVSALEMAARIQAVQAASLPWLVAETTGPEKALLGYAYATPWKSRAAYRYSVESSVYLQPQQTGRGYGRLLYTALLDTLVSCGSVHSVMGGIALPNAASVALHECLGFTKVAHLNEVGFKRDQWLDVGYWQRLLPG